MRKALKIAGIAAACMGYLASAEVVVAQPCKSCNVECRNSNPIKKASCEAKKSACFKTCF